MQPPSKRNCGGVQYNNFKQMFVKEFVFIILSSQVIFSNINTLITNLQCVIFRSLVNVLTLQYNEMDV